LEGFVREELDMMIMEKKADDRGVSRRFGGFLVATAVIVLVTASTGLGIVGCAGWGAQSGSTVTSTPDGSEGAIFTEATTSAPASDDAVTAGSGLVSPAQQVAAVLGPSVVYIRAGATASNYFLGPQSGYTYEWEASGVIYTSDGMIITNKHVVTDEYDGDLADEIEVTLATGEILEATVVGVDPLTDLAVVKVDAGFELPVASFLTDEPEVGEYAVAIGSALGYKNSVSLGIVSGLDRSIEDEWGIGIESIAYTHLIQTDASISPGNSGGALANTSGEVIGINVAYEPPSTGAVSIGFAIPSAVVTEVADEIIGTGKATHAYLGVSTREVTPALQQQFGLPRSSGVLVAQVFADGPAGKAGIQQGDIVVEIDGDAVVSAGDLQVYLRDKNPGDIVEVTIDRNGETLMIPVTLEERPADY
jgi:S1-C subfamily serine protease